MKRFHIGRDGEPRECKATPGERPLGGEHYGSMEEAQEAAEAAARPRMGADGFKRWLQNKEQKIVRILEDDPSIVAPEPIIREDLDSYKDEAKDGLVDPSMVSSLELLLDVSESMRKDEMKLFVDELSVDKNAAVLWAKKDALDETIATHLASMTDAFELQYTNWYEYPKKEYDKVLKEYDQHIWDCSVDSSLWKNYSSPEDFALKNTKIPACIAAFRDDDEPITESWFDERFGYMAERHAENMSALNYLWFCAEDLQGAFTPRGYKTAMDAYLKAQSELYLYSDITDLLNDEMPFNDVLDSLNLEPVDPSDYELDDEARKVKYVFDHHEIFDLAYGK